MIRGILITIFFTSLFSCTNRSYIPPEVIKTDRMENILWDMIRADFLAKENVKQDSTKNIINETRVLTEKVMAIYHIDKIQFDNSIRFYSSHPDMMNVIFDSLNARKSRNTYNTTRKIKDLKNM